eukprot:scaffold71264_cov32-Tisochrysis_lutea.AAC.1
MGFGRSARPHPRWSACATSPPSLDALSKKFGAGHLACCPVDQAVLRVFFYFCKVEGAASRVQKDADGRWAAAEKGRKG